MGQPDPLHVLNSVATKGVAALEDTAVLDVGSAGYLDYLEAEVLERLVEPGGATCRFFEGPYGAGKTHLLRMISSRAFGRGMAVVETELSNSLRLEDWDSVTKHILQKIQIQHGHTSAMSLPKVLDALAREGADGRELMVVRVPHPGFRNAIAHYMKPETSRQGRDLLGRFLRGERARVGDLRRAGVHGVKNPLSKRNAEQVLNTVVTSLHHLGVSGTLLAFDENERTLQTQRANPPKRVRVAANIIRRLVDNCPTGRVRGLCAVFAVLPGFLSTCTVVYPALGQRLALRRVDHDRTSWRWPVLPLGAVTEVGSPEEFLEGAVNVMIRLASSAGASANGLAQTLTEGGSAVLRQNASDGYRRPLMKRLAALTLQHIEA